MVLELQGTDRWVSCSQYASDAASRYRHIVARGRITSACGATASDPSVWRANKKKPPCPMCVEKYQKDESR